MYFKMKPWNGNERLYFYRQSQQLAGQTGQIGKLRADFDRDGNGFFTSWEDIRDHLKTDNGGFISIPKEEYLEHKDYYDRFADYGGTISVDNKKEMRYFSFAPVGRFPLSL